LRLVGVGQMDQAAQVYVDGFVSREELFENETAGAVGELIGWAFDAEGRVIDGGTNNRLTASPCSSRSRPDHRRRVGPAKVAAIKAALKGAC